jgi:hypothetical protein
VRAVRSALGKNDKFPVEIGDEQRQVNVKLLKGMHVFAVNKCYPAVLETYR